MKQIFLVLAVAALTSACASGRALSTTCGGTSGYAATKITYGDSVIEVKPKSKGKKNRELQFSLFPKIKSTDLTDYKDVTVTVKGKDAASSWISGSSTYNTAPVFFGGCVPTGATPGTVYTYEIEIIPIGKLDPRVEVTY